MSSHHGRGHVVIVVVAVVGVSAGVGVGAGVAAGVSAGAGAGAGSGARRMSVRIWKSTASVLDLVLIDVKNSGGALKSTIVRFVDVIGHRRRHPQRRATPDVDIDVEVVDFVFDIDVNIEMDIDDGAHVE